MRLGGWQRVGIILSVAWALAGPTYWNDRLYDRALKDAGDAYHECREISDPALCAGWQETIMKSGMANFAPIGSVGWALEAIVPIAFGWIVVYLIVGLWRWVRAGFAIG